MNIQLLLEVLKNSFLITGLVITMMLMIEFLNVKSHGNIFRKLQGSSIKQVITAACLGLIPGCVGGIAVVSLYTHRLLSFGALIAMMICSSGDEAFVMLAMIPEEALVLFGALFGIAVITGFAVDKIAKKRNKNFSCKQEYEIHNEEQNTFPSIFKLSSYKTLIRPNRQRVILIAGLLFFATALLSGLLEHSHHAPEVDGITTECSEHAHEHHHHGIELGGLNLLNERWLNITFGILSLITLLFISVSNNHFIESHLWNHVVKNHLLSVFLWTFGAMLLLQLIIINFNMDNLIQDNILIMIVIAVLVGFIPESGPHLFFVTLFAGGVIPFSVLLANSIVQDGHTTLPLLAESKTTFLKAKLINMAVGLVAGVTLYFIGY